MSALTPAAQQRYAELLREREIRTIADLSRNEDAARPPSLDEEIGRLTRMDALQQQQMALHARRRLDVQLSRIRGALQRIAEGSFGDCAMCAVPVGEPRLQLVPETPFCRACQEGIERSQAR